MKGNRLVFLLGLACLIAARATGRDLFYNLTYLIAAIIVLSYLWTWTSIRWVHVTRYLWAKKAEVGKTSEERFMVRNTSLLPKLWLEVRDHSDLPDHQASHVLNSFDSQDPVPAARPLHLGTRYPDHGRSLRSVQDAARVVPDLKHNCLPGHH